VSENFPSAAIVSSLSGRKAFEGKEPVTIETWSPFGAAMCDVRVRTETGRVYWTSLHMLRPEENAPAFPRRGEIQTQRDRETLASLEKIRADLVSEIRDPSRRWPGMEFAKAIVGRSIDGAIADVKAQLEEK
jgi:hypothetical protein